MELNVYNPNFSLKLTQVSVLLRLVLRLFVIMDIIYAMFILDIIRFRCSFRRHKLSKIKDI